MVKILNLDITQLITAKEASALDRIYTQEEFESGQEIGGELKTNGMSFGEGQPVSIDSGKPRWRQKYGLLRKPSGEVIGEITLGGSTEKQG